MSKKMEKSRKSSIWRVSVFLLFGLSLIGLTVLSGQVTQKGKPPVKTIWHVTLSGAIQGGTFTEGLDNQIHVEYTAPSLTNDFYNFALRIFAPKVLAFAPIAIYQQYTSGLVPFTEATYFSGQTNFAKNPDGSAVFQGIADFINYYKLFPNPDCIPYGFGGVNTVVQLAAADLEDMQPGDYKTLSSGLLGFNFNRGPAYELHGATPVEGLLVTRLSDGWEFKFSQGIYLQEEYIEYLTTKPHKTYIMHIPQAVITQPVYFTVTWIKN